MTDIGLPSSVTRPLVRGSALLLIFLVLFGFWAVFAPLATTLHLSGKIVSSRPTVDLQHPYGGQILDTKVRRHAIVQKGEVLLRLDVSLELQQLELMTKSRSQIASDIAALEGILNGTITAAHPPDYARGSQFVQRVQQAAVQQDMKQQTARSLGFQSDALDKKIALAEAQYDLMRSRHDRLTALKDKGLARQSEDDVLQEQILILQSEIEDDRASLHALMDQREQSLAQAKLIPLALREGLVTTLQENRRLLQDMDAKIAGLKDRVQKAEVRSPITGTVSDVHFQASNMYLGRGSTILSLAEPIAEPFVSFQVPVSQIDQILPGMTGRMTLTSLPQRNAPSLDIVVTSMSPRAEIDEAENPISYVGFAKISDESLQLLKSSLEDIELTEDMPAHLMIEAKQTTLFDYIVAPFLQAFRNGLQD